MKEDIKVIDAFLNELAPDCDEMAKRLAEAKESMKRIKMIMELI
jgi:hypothetical protein